MNDYQKYKLKKRMKLFGNLLWEALTYFSYLTIFLFIIITCVVFWQTTAIDLYLNSQVNILSEVLTMFLTVIIAIIIVTISLIKRK